MFSFISLKHTDCINLCYINLKNTLLYTNRFSYATFEAFLRFYLGNRLSADFKSPIQEHKTFKVIFRSILCVKA